MMMEEDGLLMMIVMLKNERDDAFAATCLLSLPIEKIDLFTTILKYNKQPQNV